MSFGVIFIKTYLERCQFTRIRTILKIDFSFSPAIRSPVWKNFYRLYESLESLGIMRTQLRAPLKPISTTVNPSVPYSRSFRRVLNMAPIMPRHASLKSTIYFFCIFFHSLEGAVIARIRATIFDGTGR